MLTIRRFLLAALLLSIAATAATAAFWHWRQEQEQLQALQQPLPAAARLHIPRGTSLSKIADLAAEQMPVSPPMFTRLARRLNVAQSLQAGVYDFPAGITVETVLRDIAAGKVVVEKIALIEGRRFADWRSQLAQDQRLEQQLPAMSDDDIRRALNISETHLEGLFLPDTYHFQPHDSDLSILRRARRQMQQFLDKHWEARQDGDLLKTPYEALILASIVEKETGKAEERPLIASVFLNRLRKGIRLQADPTVIYGLGDEFDGNLTRAHLRRHDTPYNTYMRAGLPPTPIAIPSAAAIQAVLNPADSDYYYFVATGDGGHYFSKTLREHNNAVNRYQR